MKKTLLILCLLLPSYIAAQSAYDSWLRNEGYYLLSQKDKEKFQALPDPEKEVYIRNLWAALDPNPVTPENEFQDEYMKRFEYAKKHFNIPSDRAKIYILLGPPNATQNYDNSDKYFPLTVWSYFSLGYKGLPPSLDLMFFKRFGAGDYRLYSPLFDGIKALTPSQINFDDPRQQAMLKAYFDSDVVDASQRLSIGASPNESEEIRMVLQDPEALQKIEKKRPAVETTVVYEGFQADVLTYCNPKEEGVLKTNFAIGILPKYLSFEKNEAEYRARVDLIGRVVDDKGREILRLSDSPALKMSEEEFSRAKSFLFSYLFDGYLLPGKYTLECLFRDYVSNGAGRLEKTFEVQAPKDSLDFLPILLSYKYIEAPSPEVPFVFDTSQYFPKENSTFNNNQVLVLVTQLNNPKKEMLDGLWTLKIGLLKKDQPALEISEEVPVSTNGNLTLMRKLKLQSLAEGNYTLYLKFSQKDRTIETQAPITIGANPEVLGRLRIVPVQNSAPEAYHTNLALQYFYKGELEQAAKHIRIALDFAPSLYSAKSLSARIEQARGNTDAAIAAYQKLLVEAPSDSEGFFLIGKWSAGKKDWQTASTMFKKAIELGYYTTELLNDLGNSEQQLGHTVDAIGYWEKSLALDSNQPEITKLIQQNKKS